MYTLIHTTDMTHQAYLNLPVPVQQEISTILTIYDDSYGFYRDPVKDLGGYVIGIEGREDFDTVNTLTGVDLNHEICEFALSIDEFTCCLILLSSDYSLYFIIPVAITPENILKQVGPNMS